MNHVGTARTELTGVGTEVDGDAFGFEAPPGVRVLVDPNPLAEAGVSAGMVARQATQATGKILTGIFKRLAGGS